MINPMNAGVIPVKFYDKKMFLFLVSITSPVLNFCVKVGFLSLYHYLWNRNHACTFVPRLSFQLSRNANQTLI